MKAKVFMTFDSETVGLGSRALIFDLAYVISTRKKVLLERTFLIREVLTNPRTMLFALLNENWRQSFGGKIFSHYIPAIHAGRLRLYGWREVCEIMRDDMLTYSVDVFTAYNLNFDTGALSRTQNHICDGGKILNYKPTMLDLWLFSCTTVCNTKMFHKLAHEFGEEFGWITPAGNVRTTAEKTHAYLSGDYGFIESHTALEDAQIETEILQRLLSKHKTIPYDVLDYMPWRHAQRVHGRFF